MNSHTLRKSKYVIAVSQILPLNRFLNRRNQLKSTKLSDQHSVQVSLCVLCVLHILLIVFDFIDIIFCRQ